jgi:hypothetical protein
VKCVINSFLILVWRHLTVTPCSDFPCLHNPGDISNAVNGYHEVFRDETRFFGYEVIMIGCLADGNFEDNRRQWLSHK